MKKHWLRHWAWLLLIVMCGLSVSANTGEGKNIQEKSALVIPASGTQGVQSRVRIDGSIGPDDFWIIDADNVLVLDVMGRRVQHYRNQEYFCSYSLHLEGNPHRLLYKAGTLYVLGSKSVEKIILESARYEMISLPAMPEEYEHFGDFIDDLLWENDRLILVSEYLGNYEYREDEKSFVKSSAGYSSGRKNLSGSEIIAIHKGEDEWNIGADNCTFFLVSFFEGKVLAYVYDFNKGKEDPAYCTLRWYSMDGTVLAESLVDQNSWNYVPANFVRLTEDGKVYVLSVFSEYTKVQEITVGKENVAEADPPAKDSLPDVDYDMLETAGEGSNRAVTGPYDPQHVGISRGTVASKALSMINLSWTFYDGHNKWYSLGIVGPVSLTGETPPTTVTDIPYCWGGRHGDVTVTDSTGATYTRFADMAVITESSYTNRRKYAAGNDTTTYCGSAIGLDCSGFVSRSYGFINKVPTGTFYSDTTYFTTITWSQLKRMDMIVVSGHMLLFNKILNSSTGKIQSYESCSSQGKAVVNPNWTRSMLEGDGYIYRRPKQWNNCSHSSFGYTYGYDSSVHWKKCNFCEGEYGTATHVFISNGTNEICACGYTR